MSVLSEMSAAMAEGEQQFETFAFDGREFFGVEANTGMSTQMLTGGFQGRSEIVIRATKQQFANFLPPRMGTRVARLLNNTFWDVTSIDLDDPIQFVFTLKRPISQT